MSKFRFREYDALALRKKVPGDQVASAHHISKRKQTQKDLEVVFDPKDYKEYATGFRKRKQQRRQDAMKKIKEKERVERNQQRSERRTQLKEQLGLDDNYGVESSSGDDEADEGAQPHSVTVYRGEGGMTTTVNVTALESSDVEEEEEGSSGDGDPGGEEEDGEGGRAGPGPLVGRRTAARGAVAGGRGGKPAGRAGKGGSGRPHRPGDGKGQSMQPKGGVSKGTGRGKGTGDKKRHKGK